MNISSKITSILLSVFMALFAISCEKSEDGVQPEKIYGSFVYEGNTYNIRSVVVYHLDNGQTEIWISETAGYTTVDQIENSVGELVLTVQTSKIGEGKQTFEKEGQFIKYDSKVNSGWCAVKCDLNKSKKNISLEFSSQELKSSVNDVAGKYEGPYSEYNGPKLTNQWAYNRNARAITSVDYFEMEDGAPSRLVVYDGEKFALDLELDQTLIGSQFNIGSNASSANVITSMTYDDGEEFRMTDASGKTTASGIFLVKPNQDNSNIIINIKLTNEAGKTLMVNYDGAYRHRYGNKTNRCIYRSDREGDQYAGKFTLESMDADDMSGEMIFKFTPGTHESATGLIDHLYKPTLRVSRSLINTEKEINLRATTYPWNFYYYNFQVTSYDPDIQDQNYATAESAMKIEREGDIYKINLEVTYLIKKTVTQNKLNPDGTPVMVEQEKKDENGLPVVDEEGNPIMEEVNVTEQVEKYFPTSIDLYYSGTAN